MTAEKLKMETGAIKIGEFIRYMWYYIYDICMKLNLFLIGKQAFSSWTYPTLKYFHIEFAP